MKIPKKIWLWIPTIIVVFIIIWPVYWIVKSSFTRSEDLFKSPIEYLPVNLTTENYEVLARIGNLWEHIRGTSILIVAVLIFTILLCSLAGYGFARCKTKGIQLGFTFILLSNMIPGTVTVLPLLILMRALGLTDTYHGMIFLYCNMVIPFSVVMYAGFIGQIPESLEESARIDGASMMTAFLRIVLPLLRPIMATLCIINFITSLNEFFTPLIFSNSNVSVLSILVTKVPNVNQYEIPWGTTTAAGCLMLLPVIAFVMLFEKQIMSGMMMGSIKQ